NTYGLEYLSQEILPALRKTFDGKKFEVHILGRGEPHPVIARYLAAPEIRVRGFVQDIDSELLSADVFLCANNATEYKVGHTRYLHAWSLGCCVVAHQDCRLSMPEMENGKNALLGGSATEIADCIAQAAG